MDLSAIQPQVHCYYDFVLFLDSLPLKDTATEVHQGPRLLLQPRTAVLKKHAYVYALLLRSLHVQNSRSNNGDRDFLEVGYDS